MYFFEFSEIWCEASIMKHLLCFGEFSSIAV